MQFHLTHSFPVPASRVWEVAVEGFGDYETWDRSVHRGRPVPNSNPIDGIEHSAFLFDTAFGQLTFQILEIRRDGNGGVMRYTIAEGLPFVVRDGRAVWTISSAGSDQATLNIYVALNTNFLGTVASPFLKMMFRRGDKQLLEDMHDYLVTGTPSAAKLKAIAKRAAK